MTFARFLVIGGAGFIGSHLVERLVERGPVTVFDDLSTGKREHIAPIVDAGAARFVEGSANDLHELTRAMQRHDVVVHLAESPEQSLIERDPAMTQNVLEAMRRTGSRRLLYASSGEVYGENCDYCAEHDLSDLPSSVYGAAKLACEAVIAGYVQRLGIQSWIFRIGEVVGPRCRRGPLVDALSALLAGGDLALAEDPERTRPFLHVDDCVEGMLFAYDRATEALNVFNLAPGDYTSTARVVELCAELTRLGARPMRWNPAQGPPGAVLHRRMDSSKLDALGWETVRTSDEAVRDALPAVLDQMLRSARGARPTELAI